MDQQPRAVAGIAAMGKRFHSQKKLLKIWHVSTNSTRKTSVQFDQVIDTSKLPHIHHVNVRCETALVKPNVSMEC